jgi:hypothetical protein
MKNPAQFRVENNRLPFQSGEQDIRSFTERPPEPVMVGNVDQGSSNLVLAPAKCAIIKIGAFQIFWDKR